MTNCTSVSCEPTPARETSVRGRVDIIETESSFRVLDSNGRSARGRRVVEGRSLRFQPEPVFARDLAVAHTGVSLLPTFLCQAEVEKGLLQPVLMHAMDTFWLGGTYRWIDFTDDAPYRGDVTGDLSLYSLSLGWLF